MFSHNEHSLATNSSFCIHILLVVSGTWVYRVLKQKKVISVVQFELFVTSLTYFGVSFNLDQ